MKNYKSLLFAATVSLAAGAFTSCNQPPAPATPAAAEPSRAIEQNKQLTYDFIDAFNARDFNKVSSFFADDYVYHPVDSVRGPQKGAAYVKGFADAFDAKLSVIQLVAEGDKVTYHLQVTGKNIAAFGGMPANNKEINVQTIGIFRIKDGKVAEEWEIFEEMKMMQQLGALPM